MSNHISVQKQVESIEKSIRKATQNKDSAIRFLRDAGITKPTVRDSKERQVSHTKSK